jgi:hypothetical protein
VSVVECVGDLHLRCGDWLAVDRPYVAPDPSASVGMTIGAPVGMMVGAREPPGQGRPGPNETRVTVKKSVSVFSGVQSTTLSLSS